MVAAWTFDEGGGETTVDVTGKGHDGKVVGEPEWVEGVNGKGLRIMDASQYVLVRDADDLHFEGNDFTFTAWINIDNFGEASPPCILSKRSLQDGDGRPSLIWVVSNDSSQLELQMRDDEAGIESLTAKTQLEEKKWYHVAVVKDIWYNCSRSFRQADNIMGAYKIVQVWDVSDGDLTILAIESSQRMAADPDAQNFMLQREDVWLHDLQLITQQFLAWMQ